MIDLKTTALFGLGLDLLKLFSKKETDLSKLLLLIGEYFQIRDDYANLKIKEYADQKTAFEDITEGELFGLLLINYYRLGVESTLLSKHAPNRINSIEYSFPTGKYSYPVIDAIRKNPDNRSVTSE